MPCEYSHMVDTQTETVITFTDAAHVIPGRPHVSQVYRWAQRGLQGVKLEWIQIGGTRCTSLQALQRFFVALTAARSGQPLPSSTPRARQQHVDQAVSELVSAGFEVGSAV